MPAGRRYALGVCQSRARLLAAECSGVPHERETSRSRRACWSGPAASDRLMANR